MKNTKSILATLAALGLFAMAVAIIFLPKAYGATDSGITARCATVNAMADLTTNQLLAAANSTQMTIYVFSTVAGSFQPYFYDMAGNQRALSGPFAIQANILTTITFNFYVRRSLGILTVTGPGTACVDMYNVP